MWKNAKNVLQKCEKYSKKYCKNVKNIQKTVAKVWLNYYTFDRSEIDFIIQFNNEIIPIEVKSGENFSNSSLSKYNEKNNNGISVRFSLNNLKQDGKILNIPLFMIEEFERIIRNINF